MSDIKGQRLLRKLIPGCVFSMTLESPYVELDVANGWEVVTNDSGTGFLVYRTYFDIAGWSKEQLSAFISGAGFQESDRWTVNDPQVGGASGAELNTYDIVSKSYIGDDALNQDKFQVGWFGWDAPGMIKSNYNLEEIFSGRHRQFIPNSTLNNIIHQTQENLWGAGDATAGDKIYITRIISPILILGPETVGVVPSMAVIVPAILADEKDLVYMERLRRSYVLAESRNP